MRTKCVTEFPGSAVRGRIEVILIVKDEESAELRAALAVVDRYKKEVFKAIKKERGHSPKDSDWYMLNFGVKNDRVIVDVDEGACG